MKQIIQSLLLVAVVAVANAQTEKKDWLVGGNFNLNTARNTTSIVVTPSAGYFVINNLALGGNLQFQWDKLGDNTTTTFGIGPYVRFYFTKNIFRPFLYGDIQFITSTVSNPAGSNTVNGYSYLLGVGGAFFINDNVAIEAISGYAHSKVKGVEGSGGYALRVGFQVYLNQLQVSKLKNN